MAQQSEPRRSVRRCPPLSRRGRVWPHVLVGLGAELESYSLDTSTDPKTPKTERLESNTPSRKLSWRRHGHCHVNKHPSFLSLERVDKGLSNLRTYVSTIQNLVWRLRKAAPPAPHSQQSRAPCAGPPVGYNQLMWSHSPSSDRQPDPRSQREGSVRQGPSVCLVAFHRQCRGPSDRAQDWLSEPRIVPSGGRA